MGQGERDGKQREREGEREKKDEWAPTYTAKLLDGCLQQRRLELPDPLRHPFYSGELLQHHHLDYFLQHPTVDMPPRAAGQRQMVWPNLLIALFRCL